MGIQKGKHQHRDHGFRQTTLNNLNALSHLPNAIKILSEHHMGIHKVHKRTIFRWKRMKKLYNTVTPKKRISSGFIVKNVHLQFLTNYLKTVEPALQHREMAGVIFDNFNGIAYTVPQIQQALQ